MFVESGLCRDMVLLACNGIPFAVVAGVVHATLSEPPIEITALLNLNVIVYDGVKVPVIDLLEFCGLGRIDRSNDTVAIVVALKTGYVALLISNVLDVVRTRVLDVRPSPAFALPRRVLFAGSLPLSAVPADVVTRFAGSLSQFLVIDAAQLQADAGLLAGAGMNDPTNGKQRNPLALVELASANRRPMITFMLETEHATPLEHVREILAYQPGTELFRSAGPMLGLMVHRSRSIPVMCLGQMFREARKHPHGGVADSGGGIGRRTRRFRGAAAEFDRAGRLGAENALFRARCARRIAKACVFRVARDRQDASDRRSAGLVASLRDAVPLSASA